MVGFARDEGFTTVIVPEADAGEASLVDGMNVVPVSSLAQLVSYLRGEIPAPEYIPGSNGDAASVPASFTDMAHIKGQEHVKRALEAFYREHTNDR